MNKDPAIEDAQRLARRDNFTAAEQRARNDKAATLTDKLRLIAAWHTPGGSTPVQACPPKHLVCAEAADEIERLQRLYESAVHGRADMRSGLRTARAALQTSVTHDDEGALD